VFLRRFVLKYDLDICRCVCVCFFFLILILSLPLPLRTHTHLVERGFSDRESQAKRLALKRINDYADLEQCEKDQLISLKMLRVPTYFNEKPDTKLSPMLIYNECTSGIVLVSERIECCFTFCGRLRCKKSLLGDYSLSLMFIRFSPVQ
jgi:hypothetical protein